MTSYGVSASLFVAFFVAPSSFRLPDWYTARLRADGRYRPMSVTEMNEASAHAASVGHPVLRQASSALRQRRAARLDLDVASHEVVVLWACHPC